MSALDDLSPVARHALWASCMDSNVPVQIADPATVERVTALLRSESPINGEGPAFAAEPPSRYSTIAGRSDLPRTLLMAPHRKVATSE